MMNLSFILIAPLLMAMIDTSGAWDSQVLVAFCSVTIPLLAAQYWQYRKAKLDAEKVAADVKVEAQKAAVTVKADLAVAKAEIQDYAAERNETLNEVKTLVNGDRAAKEAHNIALQAQLRAHGIEPVLAKAVPQE